jgi:hypothetical protein
MGGYQRTLAILEDVAGAAELAKGIRPSCIQQLLRRWNEIVRRSDKLSFVVAPGQLNIEGNRVPPLMWSWRSRCQRKRPKTLDTSL